MTEKLKLSERIERLEDLNGQLFEELPMALKLHPAVKTVSNVLDELVEILKLLEDSNNGNG